MAIGDTVVSQLQLNQSDTTHDMTLFSPPGLSLSTARYPVLLAGVLASTQPSEYLSIYDHSEAWGGLEREAILSMRRNLYRLVLPVNAREMQPSTAVELLQTMALSVSPVALEVETPSLPPRTLQPVGGMLPCGPLVTVSKLHIISEPEVSRVAQRVSQRDIPSHEAINVLLDYDYSLDQVARLMAVGLLGRHQSRRLVPLRGAYKAVIDSFVNEAIMNLVDYPQSDVSKLHVGTLFGDTVTVLMVPGDARVDYLRLDRTEGDYKLGTSFEGLKGGSSDSKTSVFADHARFSAYGHLSKEKRSSHVTIFHLSRNRRNDLLGPWLVRAGVAEALQSKPIELENRENVLNVLESVLSPGIDSWGEGNQLKTGLGIVDSIATFA
ncbi:MAG: hypothetical protein EAX95_06965 [Candidatus Thorarchaeota archaeon]|nr:hypothetical protein [Candidatus Thorarchaeota archaeon]